MGDVSEKCFCELFVGGFRSDSRGRFSMVFDGFGEGGSVSQALGRSVRRSVGRSGARSVSRALGRSGAPWPAMAGRKKQKDAQGAISPLRVHMTGTSVQFL